MRLNFKNKYLRFIWQLCLGAISFPCKSLCFFIPVNNRIWVFGNIYGYKDNPRYVYDYLHQIKDPSVRAIWISKNKEDIGIQPQNEHYYYLSIKGLFYQYRAGVAMLATGMNDIAAFTLVNKKIVQLWHGVPIKKLLLDSKETSPFPSKFKTLNQLFKVLLKRKLSRYNMICAVNQQNQQCLAQAFCVPIENVVITGMPRHDVILDSVSEQSFYNQGNKRILYAPTWQASTNDARKWVFKVLNPDFMCYCRNNSIDVDISIHPLNQNVVSDDTLPSGVNILLCPDINAELKHYDLLITDFSSIAFDFAVLGRPVLFSCVEIDAYEKQRGIYSEFADLLRSKNLASNQLVQAVKDVFNNKESLEKFYSYPHLGEARHRVIQETKKLL
ncbi:hypothetical protein A9264_15285 [Vibrio sp. UCD-FRSSP16_10]|nr:hypothetical protein A9260_13950 [Vibrio sp. UCD-FRSSP16_30]OBT19221.1 hypothetical protein A9264_15285 [Vibrio sp. UCD-FRSSP16_10]